MKLLLTGDIHLGRTSTRTGDTDPLRHGTTAAWNRMVDLAIREKVRVVCLSGDIVDGQNRYWESVGPLNDGIRRLGEAGILTIAVAGNHDHDVFPKLAATLPDDVFRFLGAGGAWEREVVDNVLAIDGWSFPGPSVRTDPVEAYALERPSGIPVMGMVHGDLGVPDSRYAPLSMDRLQRTGVDAWLLGHIHVPLLRGESPWILYPGSPQALDPGERGVHGPWLVTVDGGRIGKPAHVQLSSVFYDAPEFDVSSWENPEQDVRRALLAWFDAVSEGHDLPADTACLRPVLIGRSALSRELRATMESLRQTDGGMVEGDTRIVIDRWTDGMLPELDVDAWRGTDSVPGELMALSEGTIPADVIRSVRARASAFTGIPEADIPEEDVVRYIGEAAGVLLSEVMK